MRVLIAGCGYIGIPLGAQLAMLGHEVFGLRRTDSAAPLLTANRIIPLKADISKPADLTKLPSNYDWVVSCAASSGGGADAFRSVYLQGTQNLIQWLRPNPPSKFVYTSSTSVYGQVDGSIVNEDSPTEPETETSKILVETERLLLEKNREEGLRAVILRVAGIYGPDRGHYYKQLTRNEGIAGDGRRLLNMIHRDDVAGAIIPALQRGKPGAIYNAVDNEPVTQLDFFTWLSSTLGVPPPSFTAEGPTRSKRALTHKRVSNHRLRTELGYEFKYPTFREGYSAELKRGTWDSQR